MGFAGFFTLMNDTIALVRSFSAVFKFSTGYPHIRFLQTSCIEVIFRFYPHVVGLHLPDRLHPF